jgi:hypothetical protein
MVSHIEVELLDGSKKLLARDWNRVYNLVEKSSSNLEFISKFPFFKHEFQRYVQFKFMLYGKPTIYDDMYAVKCTILQLAKLFGVEDTIVPFESSINSQLVNKL